MLTEVSSFLGRKGKDDLLEEIAHKLVAKQLFLSLAVCPRERTIFGQLVLVSDHGANGQFLIHYFISQALKDGLVVYLVSFAQSFIHYSSVAAKLGVNLSRFQTSGQLVYVDCLSHLLDGMWAESDGSLATPPNKSSSTSITYKLDSDGTLRGLYEMMQSSLSYRTTQSPVCIVLDDLGILTSLGVRTRNITSFIRYCLELISGPQLLANGYVVAMVHCEGEEEEEERLCSRLLCHAHLNLSVTGIETGYSRDIHGEVKAEWRDPCPQPSFSPTAKHAQFKLSDKTVRLFAKGTSSAVL